MGVVTALHHLPVGAVWPEAEIRARRQLIEADNGTHTLLHWLVMESLPVHEDIKKAGPCPVHRELPAEPVHHAIAS